VGTLSGLANPTGLCVDRSGDVWAVTSSNSGAGALIEYAHGGTSPIATLSVPGTTPYGCAVDPTTGNLAVTSSGDSVSIFSNASGSPATYAASSFYEMFYCGYDNQGNLFADGNSQSGAQLAELAKGGESLENVTVNASLNYPGAVQWDGKYLAVAELSPKTSGKEQIYRVKVNGSQGTVAATVTLLGKHFIGGFQGWIQGGTYIQPNKQSHTEGLWKYPKGGKATKNITTTSARVLWGATVSLAK
jgi:DNA-binding beta-propeller fold protein YncE